MHEKSRSLAAARAGRRATSDSTALGINRPRAGGPAGDGWVVSDAWAFGHGAAAGLRAVGAVELLRQPLSYFWAVKRLSACKSLCSPEVARIRFRISRSRLKNSGDNFRSCVRSSAGGKPMGQIESMEPGPGLSTMTRSAK